MEQKVVKLEIGKVFTVVIAIIVIAIIAAYLIQSGTFKGEITTREITESTEEVKPPAYEDTESLELLKRDIDEGMDVAVAIDNFVKNTGVALSSEEEAVLVNRLKGETNMVSTDTAVSNFAYDLEQIESGVAIPKFSRDVEGKTDNSANNFILDTNAAIEEADKLAISQFDAAVAKFKTDLRDFIAKTEFAKADIDKIIDASVVEFKRAVDSGVDFNVAFDRNFTLTPTDFGFRDYDKEFEGGFLKIIGILRDSALMPIDPVDFNVALRDFNANIELMKRDATSEDVALLSEIQNEIDILASEFDRDVATYGYDVAFDMFAEGFDDLMWDSAYMNTDFETRVR